MIKEPWGKTILLTRVELFFWNISMKFENGLKTTWENNYRGRLVIRSLCSQRSNHGIKQTIKCSIPTVRNLCERNIFPIYIRSTFKNMFLNIFLKSFLRAKFSGSQISQKAGFFPDVLLEKQWFLFWILGFGRWIVSYFFWLFPAEKKDNQKRYILKAYFTICFKLLLGRVFSERCSWLLNCNVCSNAFLSFRYYVILVREMYESEISKRTISFQ